MTLQGMTVNLIGMRIPTPPIKRHYLGHCLDLSKLLGFTSDRH